MEKCHDTADKDLDKKLVDLGFHRYRTLWQSHRLLCHCCDYVGGCGGCGHDFTLLRHCRCSTKELLRSTAADVVATLAVKNDDGYYHGVSAAGFSGF